MNKKIESLLLLLKYTIPEDLFKEKIGTGDDLNRLINEGIVEKTISGVRVNESFYEKCKHILTDGEKLKLHTEMIESFYLPKIDTASICDYNDFSNIYIYFKNLAYHYFAINKFDESMQVVEKIAKKMFYWGLKNELTSYLESLDDNTLTHRNKLLKMYYYNFTHILSSSSLEDKLAKIEDNFQLLDKIKDVDLLLYFESRNLYGIYNRVWKSNIPEAKRTYHEVIEEIKKLQGENFQFDTILGKIYENLSFCYQVDKAYEEAEELFEKAEEHLKRSQDIYELAKLYFYKTYFAESVKGDLIWIQSFIKLNEYIDKYTLPDIERNTLKFISDVEKKNGEIENYFKLMSKVLDCDLILDKEYFINDFVAIFNVIKEKKESNSEIIVNGINHILNFLRSTDLEDEILFFELILAYLKSENYCLIRNKIKNKSLIELFNKMIV